MTLFLRKLCLKTLAIHLTKKYNPDFMSVPFGYGLATGVTFQEIRPEHFDSIMPRYLIIWNISDNYALASQSMLYVEGTRLANQRTNRIKKYFGLDK